MLESLVNHLTLPPRLPGRQDDNLAELGPEMINLLLNSLSRLSYNSGLDSLRCSLETCKVVNFGGKLQSASLLKGLQELQTGEFLALHVVEQNAALVIRRDHKERNQTIVFEAFEASPLSKEVLASENALKWDFPGCAVAIPICEFEKLTFQLELTNFLEKASTESVKQFVARTNKAQSFAIETRDSTDPALVTQMLMTLLEANGTREYTALLRKRVRDDVCWDGAQNPWRRAPFWLILRVAVQRHLFTVYGGEFGRVRYKFIMCLALAQLLDKSIPSLSLELSAHIKAKLCLRIVKLKVEKERASAELRMLYETMFKTLEPIFLQSVTTASKHISSCWDKFKRSAHRIVPSLHQRAHPRYLRLSLPNSKKYLQEVLTVPLHSHGSPQTSTPSKLSQDDDISVAMTKPGTDFANRYFSLLEEETNIEKFLQEKPGLNGFNVERCTNIAAKIKSYLTTAVPAYDSNPEQKSIMLLNVMALWKSLDETAIELFPLLGDYNPGFQPNSLDVLQLSRFSDMSRVLDIRTYLEKRNKDCKRPLMTIFDDPVEGCFAEQYYDNSNDSIRLAELHQRIEDDAGIAKLDVKEEWEEKCLEYDNRAREISKTPCENISNSGWHERGPCKRCYLERVQKRLTMEVYENPLPKDCVQAKAVIFELGCPQAFVAYRDATWAIVGVLVSQSRLKGHNPEMALQDYSKLKAYLAFNKIPNLACI